jgi:hypothetical protein
VEGYNPALWWRTLPSTQALSARKQQRVKTPKPAWTGAHPIQDNILGFSIIDVVHSLTYFPWGPEGAYPFQSPPEILNSHTLWW